MEPDFDLFLSYAHEDKASARRLRDAFERCGLHVCIDESHVSDFNSITDALEAGVSRAKALVAYYSRVYPTKRPCQWELTAAFLAAQRGGDPRQRVLVINPEDDGDHIEPVELRDAHFGVASRTDIAERVAEHVRSLDGRLGDLRARTPPRWHGLRPVGAARFVGRVGEMWRIHSALQAGQVGLITGARGMAVAQVRGLGGIGKSLLVEEYALRFGAAYPGGVFWLRAYGHDAPSDFSADTRAAERGRQLQAFAVALGVAVEGCGREEVEAALWRALESRGQPCLWVIDDLPGGLDRHELDAWLPGYAGARTLVTVRNRGYGAIGASVDLSVLDTDDAVRLLELHRQVDAGDASALRALAEDLGGHAQALDVTGAALRAEIGARSVQEYRRALARPTDDELELAAELSDALPNGHERSITVTLSRSIERLPPQGRDFLLTAALLAAEPITVVLLAGVFSDADSLDEDAGARQAVRAMKQAESASLAELVDHVHGARQVHALVARAVRFTEGDSERLRVLRLAAVRTVSAELDVLTAAPARAETGALAHARQLAASASDDFDASLIDGVADLDYARGNFGAAAEAGRTLVELRTRLNGSEHPFTLGAMSRLAAALSEQGDFAAARTLQTQVVDGYRRAFGDEGGETMLAICSRAFTAVLRGELAEGRAQLDQVLATSRRVLGEDHPVTLRIESTLASALRTQGALEQARVLHERALGTDRETLATRAELAGIEAARGSVEGAKAMQEQLVSDYGRVLGEEHPRTLGMMSELASTLRRSGHLARALALNEQVLGLRRKVLGDEHPDTLASMTNLAATLGQLEELERSQTLGREALEASRRALGDDHPATLTCKSNLAVTLWKRGDTVPARALAEQVLEARRRVLGSGHPETRATEQLIAEIGRERTAAVQRWAARFRRRH